MQNILVIYKGWEIKKFDNGFAVVVPFNEKLFATSEYKKKLEDMFFFCDKIDLQIERNKIERRSNT